MKTIESTGVAKENVVVRTSSDPTANDVEFALTTGPLEPTSWVVGSWNGTWSASTSEVAALTPTIGASGTLAITGGTDYDLWARWTVGVEVPVEHVGRFRAT